MSGSESGEESGTEDSTEPTETDGGAATTQQGDVDAGDVMSVVKGFVSSAGDQAGNAVGISEGISYGISLLVYVVGLLLVTGFISAIAFAFFSLDNIVTTLLGALFAFIANIVGLAGFLGLSYKVIADAVSRGNQHAEQ